MSRLTAPLPWRLVTGLACLALGTAVNAIFVSQEIKRVPVQRLVQNIERRLASNPDDIGLRLNLARLYAMAYALKATEFDAQSQGGNLVPWFGHQAPHLPGPVEPPASRDHQERARRDLALAVKAYTDVVARAPSHALARLGYAWSLEQSGDKARAVDEYRRVVELAWPQDRKEEAFWQEPATTEAAERLMELLDSTADAKEIEALELKVAELNAKGRMITPIAVPLGDEVRAPPLAPEAAVLFDADGSGKPRLWTWIRRDAGWLVHDADGSGRITSALQWFGNVTFWLFWRNGYDAMSALDDDGDGRLSGHELRHLAIWRDLNVNGVSDAGEVRPLSSHGIVGLSWQHVTGDGTTVAALSPAGVTFADGSTRPTYDVILRMLRPARSITIP